MMDYDLEARRKQEEQQASAYQKQRDPFQYGQDVARRRYAEIMSGLQNQQQKTAQSYSDLYQQAKQFAVAERAAGGPSLSGGMKSQFSDLISTREMEKLGQIGGAREQALRDIELQKQSAFANAQLEGQQAEQLQIQRQQLTVERLAQKNQIMSDKEMTGEQKAEQLRALGFEKEAQQAVATPEGAGIPSWLQGAGALLVAGGAALKTGAAVKAGTSLLALGGPVAWGTLALIGIAIGIDKGLEQWAPNYNEGKGLLNIEDFFQ